MRLILFSLFISSLAFAQGSINAFMNPNTGTACYYGTGTTDHMCCSEEGCKSEDLGADETPGDVYFTGQSSYYNAVTGTNDEGGDLYLRAGIGRHYIVVSDYSVGSTDVVTINVDGSSQTLTEGTDFSCATSNTVCAAALVTAIDALAINVDAYSTGTTVHLIPEVSCVYLSAVSVADGGADGAFAAVTNELDGDVWIGGEKLCLSYACSNYLDLSLDSKIELYVDGTRTFRWYDDLFDINPSNYELRFGSGGHISGDAVLCLGDACSTSHSLGAGDVTVDNDLEVDGATYLDGTLTVADDLTSSAANDIGWTMQSGANTACNTTCTSGCVFGYDSDTEVFVNCDGATADVCLCAGPS